MRYRPLNTGRPPCLGPHGSLCCMSKVPGGLPEVELWMVSSTVSVYKRCADKLETALTSGLNSPHLPNRHDRFASRVNSAVRSRAVHPWFRGAGSRSPQGRVLMGGRGEEYRIHCRSASRQSVLWYVLSRYSYPPPYYVLCTVRGDETGAEDRGVLSPGWPCRDCSAGTRGGAWVSTATSCTPSAAGPFDLLVAGPDPSRCRVVWLDNKHAWVMATGIPLHPQSSLCSSRPVSECRLFPFLPCEL